MKDESAAYWKGITVGYCSPLTGAEKASCLSDVKNGKASNKDFLANLKDTALATCDTNLANCLLDCAAPPVS